MPAEHCRYGTRDLSPIESNRFHNKCVSQYLHDAAFSSGP
jgi:hypothetical protein